MELNADFSQRAVVHGSRIKWVDSPMPGVKRRMLDRIGGEVARATSIVSYARNSHFSAHVHHGGEEFLILEGTFEDEHGCYPAGSYVRNPPGTAHTPGSSDGCVMLVKLWQFDPDDRTAVVLNVNEMTALPDTHQAGIETALLHRDERETVRIERWPAGCEAVLDTRGGTEIFVLDGSFEQQGEPFSRWSWLRLPSGTQASIRAGSQGASLWLKNGHLAHVRLPEQV